MKLRVDVVVLVACVLIAYSLQLPTELNHRAIVTALALDYDDGIYTATATVFDAKSSNETQGTGIILSAAAPTAAQALIILQQLSERELFYKHNGVLLLGSGITWQQMNEVLQLPVNVRGIRYNISAVRCEGRASEVLTAEDAPDAAEFESFFKKQRRSINCEVPLVTLADENGEAAGLLPILKLEQSQLKLSGIFLFGQKGSVVLRAESQMTAAALLTGRCAELKQNNNASLPIGVIESDVIADNGGVYCYIRCNSDVNSVLQLLPQLKEIYHLFVRSGADAMLCVSGKMQGGTRLKIGTNTTKEVLLQVR
ncbi:MAG: hypothetical protein IKV55_00315 [Oscillospiraceae bacterium]|nr:hypothetical protein [Oscillospiraceae bacterium]